jgi:hypothetical protein
MRLSISEAGILNSAGMGDVLFSVDFWGFRGMISANKENSHK